MTGLPLGQGCVCCSSALGAHGALPVMAGEEAEQVGHRPEPAGVGSGVALGRLPGNLGHGPRCCHCSHAAAAAAAATAAAGRVRLKAATDHVGEQQDDEKTCAA